MSSQKLFEFFFPLDNYIPIELIVIENIDITITKLRYDKFKNTFIHSSIIVKNNIYSQNTQDDDVICASITVPYGKILEIVKRCNDSDDQIISSICGPIKCMYINQGLFSSECILRSKDIEGISIYANINNELIEAQRKLVIRLYSKSLFNNFKFTDAKYRDIEIGTELNCENLSYYKSMIIPYGLYLDNAGELVPNPKDSASFNLKPGRLYGPCILSDTSQLYTYFKQSYIHTPIYDEGPFEKQLDQDELEPIVKQIIPEKTVVITNKRIKVNVKLSHYMYKSLRPLLGIYLMSKCLGDEYTKNLENECPWKINDDEAEQIIMYWLVKTNGDYSYITGAYNNPKYTSLCKKILSKYSKLTQY